MSRSDLNQTRLVHFFILDDVVDIFYIDEVRIIAIFHTFSGKGDKRFWFSVLGAEDASIDK